MKRALTVIAVTAAIAIAGGACTLDYDEGGAPKERRPPLAGEPYDPLQALDDARPVLRGRAVGVL